MQAPKRKTSKSKRNMRRSHHALKLVTPNTCSSCGTIVLRHHVCSECGTYRSRQVLEVASEE